MDFSDALKAVKGGAKIARKCWSDKYTFRGAYVSGGSTLHLHAPSDYDYFPWFPTQDDMLEAGDWMIV